MTESVGMKQARPRPEEFDALVEFLHDMDSLLGDEPLPEELEHANEVDLFFRATELWEHMDNRCSWQRVLYAGHTALENACDPNARTVEWKPEIKAALKAYEEKMSNEAKPATDGWEWAIVEIFGHRTHAGRTREEERFGSKMLRIDVPNRGDAEAHGWTTMYYGGSAIFSFALTDEASVIRINKPYEPASRLSYQRPEDESGVSESGEWSMQ